MSGWYCRTGSLAQSLTGAGTTHLWHAQLVVVEPRGLLCLAGGRLLNNFCMCFFFQLELITAQAMRAGFTGGMVVDYPNSAKAKK